MTSFEQKTASSATRSILGLFAVALPLLAGCEDHKMKGNGVSKIESRPVQSSFTSIEVDKSINLDFQINETSSIKVETDENIQPLVSTTVHGDSLRVTTTESIASRTGVRVIVTAPELSALILSGSADATVQGLKNPTFSVHTNGSSNVVLSGETNELKLNTSGSSDVEAFGLRASKAYVSSNGSSDVNLNVTDSISGEASGSSNIVYMGNPQVSIEQKGSVKISQK
jgi:hypothetical protein